MRAEAAVDMAEYETIKARHIAPNGHAETDALHLLLFGDMRPRLGDGYLVKHLLGSTAMAVCYGESGSGKTYFGVHFGLCVAAGFVFFGRRVRQVGVIYIAAEAGRSIENRVAAAKREIAFPETMPFAAITTPIDLCSDAADLERLIATIRSANLGRPIELIIIDTLSRVMAGGNENAPDDMGALVRNVDRLRTETGAAVLLVHHSGKDASRGARGHSLLRAATDTEIEVTRDDGSRISTARVTKQRDFATEGSMSFSLRQVELGLDGDGDPVTSCVIDEAESGTTPRATARRLSAAQGRALELLTRAIDDAGSIPPASNHIPPSVRCVQESLWREYCARGAVSSSDDQDARRMAFKRAAEALVSIGRVGKWEPLVWLT